MKADPAPPPCDEWNFKRELKTWGADDYRAVIEVLKWEYFREAVRESPELMHALMQWRAPFTKSFKSLLQAMRSAEGENYLEPNAFPFGICFASPEFPEKSALSIGKNIIQKRAVHFPIKELQLPSPDHKEFERRIKKEGLKAEAVHELIDKIPLGSDMLKSLDYIVGHEMTSDDLRTDETEVLAIKVDYTETTESIAKRFAAIVEIRRHTMFPDVKAKQRKGGANALGQLKIRLYELAAYRLRKHYAPSMGKGWWKCVRRDGVFSGDKLAKFERPANAAQSLVSRHRSQLEECKVLSKKDF